MKLIRISYLVFFFVVISSTIGLAQNIITPMPTSVNPSDLSKYEDIIRSLSPEQRSLFFENLKKSGGYITPSILEKSGSENRTLEQNTGVKVENGTVVRKSITEILYGKKIKAQEENATNATNVTSYWDIIQGKLSLEQNIRPFGYDIFKRTLKESVIAQPVPLDYIIGPGDEIQVLVWGRINERYVLSVQPDGTILLPHIGPLSVAGMNYKQMRNFIKKQIKRTVGVEAAVNLNKLRQIQVFVLGEVKNPGPYFLPAMSTMVDAIIAAGGPTMRGSLRKIVLRRRGKVVDRLDIYDLLLKGDTSKDHLLRHRDVIFVPIAGPRVGVKGNVRRPAIYELYKDLTLGKLIKLAGGLLPTAWSEKIQIERIDKNQKRVVLDIPAKKLTEIKNFSLKDGDLVKIFPVLQRLANKITLKGNVYRPGIYSYHKGMRIGEVLKTPEDLLPESFLDYGLIERIDPNTGEFLLIPFSPKKLLIDRDPQANILLQPMDTIHIFPLWELRSPPVVTVEGEVKKPGNYTIQRENFRIKDLIFLAGGLTTNAYLKKAELFRINKKRLNIDHLTFNLEKALYGDEKNNLLLQDKDKVIIHSINEFIPAETVTISGEVNKPGEYPFSKGLKVKDLIFMAGNLKDSAYLREAELISFQVVNGKKVEISRKTIDVSLALQDDPKENIFLEPYDELFIKKIPGWKEQHYVEVMGEVKFPGRYFIRPGERLSSVLKRAGGYTKDAYLRGAVFSRKSVQKKQQEILNQIISRLERELLFASSKSITEGLSKESILASQKSFEVRQKFIEHLKSLNATGRVFINLASIADSDLVLEDGDKIYIPKNPGVVSVRGAVMSPGSFVYEKGLTAWDYIEKCGGLSHLADKKQIYVLGVDGSARRVSNRGFSVWNPIKAVWEIGGDVKRGEIYPGDTIVVPEKLIYVSWLREIKDITQILMQIAVTTGTIINLW